jgi:hypothetical protein
LRVERSETATAVLNRISGRPKDASRNVWHFETVGAPTSGEHTGIGTAVASFYQGIGVHLGGNISTAANAHRVETAVVTPGAPGALDDVVSPIVNISPFAITGIVNNALPSEVAVALSFRVDVAGLQEEVGATRPRSRRRGRIYVGPVSNQLITWATPTFEPKLSVGAREAFLDAYDTMIGTLANAGTGLRHVVYSRVGAQAYGVTFVSVDDEFDTIRRRGGKPAIRMQRVVAQGSSPGSRAGVDVTLAS